MVKKFAVVIAAATILTCENFTEAQQQGKVFRIGVLSSGSPLSPPDRMEAFRQGLRERGYEEGKNVVIDERKSERGNLAVVAAELIRRKVHVVLTVGTSPTEAVRNATNTVPVVMTFVSDPVGFGFITSLARPGGNITGVTNFAPELGGKWLEIVKEVSPKTARAAVLLNPAAPIQAVLFKEMQVPAAALGIKLVTLEIHDPKELEVASATIRKVRSDALIVLMPPSSWFRTQRILELAERNRLPAMYHWREYVDTGGLAFYGASLTDMYRRAAVLVDKILKGARPADLPVEQPTKFEFVINLKAAKQIGLTIPPNVLARADRVIR